MKRSLFAVAAIAFSATVAQAQMSSTTPARPYTIGVSGGVSIPLGDLSSKSSNNAGGAKTGFNVNGILGYDSPTMPIGIRGEVNYNRFGVDENVSGISGAHWSVLGGSVNGVLNMGSGASASGIRPYVIAGIGFAQLKGSASSGGIDVSTSKSGLMLNGGIGFKIPLSGFQTFAEARYHYVMTSDDNTGMPAATYLPITFGIMF